MNMNLDILKGLGKITLGASAIGAGTIVGISGVNDIRNSIKADKLVAEAATESAEDMDLGDDEDEVENDLPEEPEASGQPQDENPEG